MKYIFVTGGVVSGLGKGITASSLAKLLIASGYSITMIKLDPYLNVDAGTMSPHKHGEVFVTADGFETDLDLGHYERFSGISLARDNSLTTGKLFQQVFDHERQGGYLGDDIQVIPHVTDAIKDTLHKLGESHDVVLVEIGGTIGDIEGPHFIEAMRQLKSDLGKDSVYLVHVVPLFYLFPSGELKTKPIQHSVKQLMSMGIHPDMLMVRTQGELPDAIKKKLSLFCGMPVEAVINAPTCASIYEVPLVLQQQNVDALIGKALFDTALHADLDERQTLVASALHATREVCIGMVAKYRDETDAYFSVVEALHHATAHENVRLRLERIDASTLEHKDYALQLDTLRKEKGIQGFLVPGGFGERGVSGKINAVTYARESSIPCLGICLGLQCMVIDYARNICGLSEANSLEFDESTKFPVVGFLPGQFAAMAKGGTMRLGSYDARLHADSVVGKLYQRIRNSRVEDGMIGISERHRHRYEVNPEYVAQLQSAGLTISGVNPETNLVEFIEITDHPYYVSTQAHPEFLSRLDDPHPLFVGLIEAANNIA